MRDVAHDEHVDSALHLVEGEQTQQTHRHVKGQSEDDADAHDGRDALGVHHRHVRGRHEAVHSQTEGQQAEALADINRVVHLPEGVIPAESPVHRSVTRCQHYPRASHDDHDAAEDHDDDGSERSEGDGPASEANSRGLPKAAQQAQRDFDKEIKDGPEAEVRQEMRVGTPRHVRHRKSEGDLVGQTSTV